MSHSRHAPDAPSHVPSSPAGGRREPSPCLLELVYELLDAGVDTLGLMDVDRPDRSVIDGLPSPAWAIHADYLRALQRRGREILAAEVAVTPAIFPDRAGSEKSRSSLPGVRR